MKARNLLAYCSGSAVEIPSTDDPYFTVLAAWGSGGEIKVGLVGS